MRVLVVVVVGENGVNSAQIIEFQFSNLRKWTPDTVWFEARGHIVYKVPLPPNKDGLKASK